ncbi:MAG: thioredoxin family protein [Muribaculaceae bacterium]|nr:thioredoxin family protein [Muribaculaceae bacterium]
MIKKLALIAAAAASIILSGCSGKSGETTTEVSEMKEQGAQVADGGLISENGLPMVVDFSATWCPPCQELKPIFEQLKDEYIGSVDFVTVDVDSVPQLAQKYDIHNIPALVYISRDGKELYRTIGFIPGDSIKKVVSQYLK